jgi:hypothetical protein
MKLKRRIDATEYAKLPAHLLKEYSEQDDGSYLLDVIGDDGQPLPVPDTGPLKRAFEAEKVERDKARAQVRDELAARASGDDGAVRKLRQKEFEDSEARIAQIPIDGQKVMADQAAHYDSILAEAGAKTKTARSTWDKAVLRYGLAKVILDAGGAPELLQGKLEKFCRVERDPETDEPRIVVVDDNGVRRDHPVTGQPISAAHALEELRLFDPRLQAAFTNGNGNGGAPTT